MAAAKKTKSTRVREVVTQLGPSCNLDEHGDPVPVRYEVSYEAEVSPGVWKPVASRKKKKRAK